MEKTNGQFNYDLNQIPYDYTVEVMNRFKGLDLVDRVSEKPWVEVYYIVQEAVTNPIPKGGKIKNLKWLSKEALQIVEKRREAKYKGERERYTQLNVEFQKIAREDNKAFLNEQCKEVEENNRMRKTRNLFKTPAAVMGIFHKGIFPTSQDPPAGDLHNPDGHDKGEK